MGFEAKILADSISPDGVRLTTFEVTFPRIVLAEWNTHRTFSRNSASSRAIPVEKMLQRVMGDPYIPTNWGKNQKGMQAEEELSAEKQEEARLQWLRARDQAVTSARLLLDIGLHKQFTNRLLEPWLWHTVIVTATEWSNFFHLRDNKDAHPDIQIPARMMKVLYEQSEDEDMVEKVPYGGWHLPLINLDDSDWMKDATEQEIAKVSIARCARVSYLTHDGKRDPEEDIKLYNRLLSSGHMSPLEHVATPMVAEESHKFWGNFRGWRQFRKTIPNEHDILRPQ